MRPQQSGRVLPSLASAKMHAATRGRQNSERRVDVLRLEIAVERVGEQARPPARPAAPTEALALRPGALRQRGRLRRALNPRIASPTSARSRGDVVAQIGKRRPARGKRRVAREIADEPVVQREAVLRRARGLHLDLHARHVDAGRAFAPARLARDAKLERLRHLVRRERIGSKLAGDRKPQRIGAPAGHVALVARDAVARAHHAARKRAAGAVVVAHLDRALKTAAAAGIGGPVECVCNVSPW